MSNNKENKKFSIKEIFTNRQYRAIAILIFYAILFAIIIIAIRVPSNIKVDDNGNNVTKLKGYELIDAKNFSYKYTVLIDDETFYYEGSKYNDKDLVTITKDEETREYYLDGNSIYIKENDNYVSTTTTPYVLFNFFDTDKLESMLLRSIVVDEANYKYKVDNQKIYDVVIGGLSQIEAGDNYINLVYRNDNITGATLNFSNYAKVMGEGYSNIVITLEYFDFNLIDDFKIQVMD